MSWTRLDDSWTERPELERIQHDDRWHYLCMIQRCSRTGNREGFLTHAAAQRCSDHPEPRRALAGLQAVGLIKQTDGGWLLLEISEHVPSDATLKRTESLRLYQKRSRAHRSGDHALCLPKNCQHAVIRDDVSDDSMLTGDDRGVSSDDVSDDVMMKARRNDDVSDDVGTGRDGLRPPLSLDRGGSSRPSYPNSYPIPQ